MMTQAPAASATSSAHDNPLVLRRSQQLLARAQQLIAGETSSMMKRADMFAPGSFPVYLTGGEGALVRDVDGQQYIDYVCGLGANTLGHNHPAIVAALHEALPGGLSHSLPHPIELDAAEAIVELTPAAEMVRFFKTGADATSAAVRLARHVTGRDRLVTVGYNGWHDHFMFDTPGVPPALAQYTTRMPLMAPEDEPKLIELLRTQGQDIALLLLSLPYNRMVSAEFLRAVQDACRNCGALFVLDEIVTGFRLAPGGAQEHYGIEADLVCLSKGLAAGMPLSAVAGPRSIMKRMAELQVSTTFGGERLSLASCVAALSVYRDTSVLIDMRALGERLRDGINHASERAGTALRVVGYPSLPCFVFAHQPLLQAELMRAFVGLMAQRGVLLRRDVNFICAAHTPEQVDHTVEAAGHVLQQMAADGLTGR